MTNTDVAARSAGARGGLVGWRIAAWTGAGLILLLPLIAMRFTEEVQWTGFDFAVAAILLGALVGAFELVVRLSGSGAYRAGIVVAAVAVFLMAWIQGAVGLVGSENAPINQIFFLPLLAGAAGAFVARFRAGGMARALWAMAAIQAATLAVGYLITRDTDAFLLLGWVAAWSLSAWLFGQAARGEETA